MSEAVDKINGVVQEVNNLVQKATDEFLYDDFFANDSAPGIEIEVPLRGKKIPFTIKRGISFKDFNEAKDAAMKMRFKPDGRPEVVSYSDHIFGVELLFRCIKGWPFRKDNQPIPVTRENIADMNPDVVGAVVAVLQEVASKGVEALAPFVKVSGDPS